MQERRRGIISLLESKATGKYPVVAQIDASDGAVEHPLSEVIAKRTRDGESKLQTLLVKCIGFDIKIVIAGSAVECKKNKMKKKIEMKRKELLNLIVDLYLIVVQRAHNSISESRIASFRAMAESRVEIEEQFGQHHDHSKLENTENSNNEPASCCDCYDKQFELEKEIEKLKEQMAQQLA